MPPLVQAKVEADATASFSTTSFTVPAGGTFTFQFTITAPTSLPGVQAFFLPIGGNRFHGLS